MPFPLIPVIVAVAPALIGAVTNIILQEKQQNHQKRMVKADQEFRSLQLEKQTELNRQIQESQQKFYREYQENDHSFRWDLQQSQQDFAWDMQQNQQDFSMSVEYTRQGFALLQTGLEWLKSYQMQKTAQDFQWKLAEENFERSVKLANLNHENSLKLEKFKQTWEELRQKDRQEFELRLFEERKKLELYLKKYERNTQILMYSIKLNYEISLIEDREILASNPLKFVPKITNQFYQQYTETNKPLPLQVIVSPPALKDETVLHYKFPRIAEIEGEITDGLRVFINKLYPLNSEARPVKFIGGELWKSKSIRIGHAAEILYFLFRSIPTLILDFVIDSNKIKLYISYWDIQSSPTNATKIIEISISDSFLDTSRSILNEEKKEGSSVAVMPNY